MFAPCVTIKTYFPATESRDTRSSQGPTDRDVSRPCSVGRTLPLQISSSYVPRQGQVAYRECPLQPQRDNGQSSNDLRRSSHPQVRRQTVGLHDQLGCREFVLPRTHSSSGPKVLFVVSGVTTLCQQQVHRAPDRTLLCLQQTRPHDIGVIDSIPAAPASPLPSSGRVRPCVLAARVDEVTKNLDNRHVDRNSSATPP